ncbi:MAG: excinuclease ABC subunit UvrC, partial [Clostridia bacterium]|nr:excinuclease ABC subunit UvrC [Clostridia bacterium]
LIYHLGKCCAPCSGRVSREEYHALLENVCRFLEGQSEPIIELFTRQMQEAAENMEYERAAMLRDRIAAIKNLGEKQQAISLGHSERDIFAFVKDGEDTVMFALFERGGKVIGAESMSIACGDESPEEITASFLKQYYADGAPVPKEVVTYHMPEEQKALEDWLSDSRGNKVSIICPQRGEKRKLTEMAYKNGIEAIVKARELQHRSWERGEGAMLRLCEVIGMTCIPERMECYDNSHIRGRDTVSGMVVFINGKSAPKEYRRFRIKAETNGDDYMAMEEVLTRRFQRAMDGDEKFAALPDLLVIDGGRGQLNVALQVLERFGLSHIPAIGLAEQNEDIILPDSDIPITLDRRDPALHIVERIRDEAHRFAITYHRSLRAKNAFMSELDKIEGMGPKRKRALFDAFVSLEAIKAATAEELAAARGMTKNAAKAVYEHFHPRAEE